MSAFLAVAEPHRRQILDRLRTREHTVGELVEDLGLSQPGVSKHLRVLREAGVVQVRVDLGPAAFAANHRHPGEEVAFVLEGRLEYTLEGRAPVTLTVGQSLFIPSGTPHSARNVGEGRASELATYIVEKGAALVEPVE